MGPGSGSPEMAARRNLAPRPPRPPLPRGSPALHAGPPRPPACSIQPTRQHLVPAPREVKHPLVWGYVGQHSLERGWGWSLGSWVAADPTGGQDAGGSRGSGGSRMCLYTWICACLHTCAVAARPGSVSPQFGAALGALPGLNKPARGDGAAAPLPPQSVRSLPGDTAARKVAGRWQAGCDSEQGDVMEVSGGPHPPLGACFWDSALSGALCAGWWAWGMLWHWSQGCGAKCGVPEGWGTPVSPQRGGTPCVQCDCPTLEGRRQCSPSSGCPCGGTPRRVGNCRQVSQGWQGTMPFVPLWGT